MNNALVLMPRDTASTDVSLHSYNESDTVGKGKNREDVNRHVN